MKRAVLLSISLGAGAAAAAEDGKAIFDARCAPCHYADRAERKAGPGLKGLFKKAKLAGGVKPTEATVRARIDAGGNGMPAYKQMLTDAEKTALLSYLKTR